MIDIIFVPLSAAVHSPFQFMELLILHYSLSYSPAAQQNKPTIPIFHLKWKFYNCQEGKSVRVQQQQYQEKIQYQR